MADTIRASVLAGYDELARAEGLDPLRMLDAAGIPRSALTTPDLKISTTAVRDLLEQSGRAAEDFGLRLSERRTPSILGPLALILREQPTVRRAMEALIRYVPLHTAANHLSMEEVGDLAILRLVLSYPTPGPSRHAVELGMGQGVRLLRRFLGEQWRPNAVSFVHARPKSLLTHQRVFGPNVTFDQPANTLTFSRADLDTLIPNADPEMARVIQHYIDGLIGAAPAGVADRVLELARELLPTGYCNIHMVAKQVGIDPRTLQRRLAELGIGFNDIVQNARLGLAAQYVEGSDMPFIEVADLLGFSAVSAFSHWHRDHCGCSASDRRRSARARTMSTQ
ncbi:MAG: AraC family transcriptional regulator [Phenylobacterium sp.]